MEVCMILPVAHAVADGIPMRFHIKASKPKPNGRRFVSILIVVSRQISSKDPIHNSKLAHPR